MLRLSSRLSASLVGTVRARTIASSMGHIQVPEPVNEPVLTYMKGSAERTAIQAAVKSMRAEKHDVPLVIGGKEIRTGDTGKIVIPHDLHHTFGHYHRGTQAHVTQAIDTALKAQKDWAAMDFESRASIFLKAADLLRGKWRATLTAATVLNQSKNFYQAEIDAACEFIDFLRFNVYYAKRIMEEQPISSPGMWNRLTMRPLEGFVFAATPFNFTAIAGNLPCTPALLGNTVVWKPSDSATLSGYYIMKLLKEAGLPDGVINFVPGEPEMVADTMLSHPQLTGVHYTGSTAVLRSLFGKVGQNINKYKTFPRIVGESGGKDFVVAHPSADVEALATGLLRGAFEYAGQKCSAASRAYVPSNLWPQLKKILESQHRELVTGNPENPETFVNAVINQGAYNRLSGAIKEVTEQAGSTCKLLLGGACDMTVGYFVNPTVIEVSDPRHWLMKRELFGPVLSIYVYDEKEYSSTLRLVDETCEYALTGSIFSQDRAAIIEATNVLSNAAGNFYINDKPTGAVVGQQPFGGARLSGTNDKAGSHLNLLRWVSPRAIKETFSPATHPLYPYMSS